MFNFFFYFYLFLPVWTIGLAVFLIFFRRHKKYVEFQRSLYFILYEITLPQEKLQESENNFKDLIGAMEQFYKGMMEIESYYALEIGLPVVGREIVFYAAMERKQSHIFEKIAQGIFPRAQISIKVDDYNIFKPEGFSLGSVAKLKREEILPIKTYDKFESDPLQIILKAFSGLRDEGEGAALQIIVSPARGKEKKLESVTRPKDENALKLFEEKVSRQMVRVNIRLVASSENRKKVESVLSELEGAFFQFSQGQGNGLQFIRLNERELKDLFYKFSFRIPEEKSMLILNTAELASIFHFPAV